MALKRLLKEAAQPASRLDPKRDPPLMRQRRWFPSLRTSLLAYSHPMPPILVPRARYLVPEENWENSRPHPFKR